jgi:DNA polymerase-3 subunit beta
MQLTIDRAALTRELALVASTAERKATIPILSHVRLEARGDRLTLTATDLQCGLIASAPATITQEGVICLPAKRLLDYTRTLAGDTVTIKTDDKQYATVTAGRARARIAGMDAVSFPELPQAPEAVVTMDARALARAFSRVAFAISQEESRFTLNGALMEVNGALVKCVATDGHRLAYVEQDGATSAAAFKGLVPKASIAHFAKLADNAEGGARVEFATDENHLFFGIDGRRMIARKLTGNFPDYARVLPKHERFVTVDREALKTALERVMQFSDERSRAVRFKFSSGELEMSAQSLESGDSAESVTLEGSTLEQLEVGFNAQYILDALNAITHPNVAVYLADAKSAGEIRPYAAGTDARFVIMPMRI